MGVFLPGKRTFFSSGSAARGHDSVLCFRSIGRASENAGQHGAGQDKKARKRQTRVCIAHGTCGAVQYGVRWHRIRRRLPLSLRWMLTGRTECMVPPPLPPPSPPPPAHGHRQLLIRSNAINERKGAHRVCSEDPWQQGRVGEQEKKVKCKKHTTRTSKSTRVGLRPRPKAHDSHVRPRVQGCIPSVGTTTRVSTLDDQ